MSGKSPRSNFIEERFWEEGTLPNELPSASDLITLFQEANFCIGFNSAYALPGVLSGAPEDIL